MKQESIPVGCVPSAAVAVRVGCLPGGGVCPGQGGLPRGICPGDVSQHALRQTPPPWTEFLTHAVKILPCRNFVADGNKVTAFIKTVVPPFQYFFEYNNL